MRNQNGLPQAAISSSRRALLRGAGGLLALGITGALDRQVAAQHEGTPKADPSGLRTVTHALGTVEIPLAPRRVVTLDKLSLETMLALGLTPIASIDGSLEPYRGLVELDLSAIVNIGFAAEPDLEQIAALQPDLILGEGTPGEGIEAIYDPLSQIAPTVAFIGGPEAGFAQRWKRTFRDYAALFGQSPAAERLLRDFEARARGFGAAFETATGESAAATTVSVIRFRTDMIRAYVASSFAGSVIAEAGLARPENQLVMLAPPEPPWVGLSLEELRAIDADHIFVFQTQAEIAEGQSELPGNVQDSPLWSQLGAVQAGNVHIVTNGELWFEGTVIAANVILDDLEAALLPESA